MFKRLRLVFKGPINPEFKASGLALDRMQFAMFNVVGRGALTKHSAIKNWFEELRIQLRSIDAAQ